MKRLIFTLLASCGAVYAQQNALLLPWTPQQFTNTNGTPLANGKVCTYLAGTSTGVATYTDSTASVANSIPPNAILLDSTGRPTSGGIWLKPTQAYKIIVLTAGSDSTCSTGVTIKTQDNVGISASVSANNTFTGTNTFTGQILCKNLENVMCVDSSNSQGWTGTDIGAWINSAYAALPSTGGEIDYSNLTTSCVTFTTPINFSTVGKYVLLRGLNTMSNANPAIAGGSCLNYTPTTATTAITLDWTATNGGGYATAAGLQNINLINNACTTNGGCGSSAIGIDIGPVNGGAHAANFNGLKVSGFSIGVRWNSQGNSVVSWGMTFTNCSFAWNTTGLQLSNGGENTTVQGCRFAVNGTGILANPGSELYVYGTSFDTNTTVAVNYTGATGLPQFLCAGCHFENLGTPQLSQTTHYIQGTMNLVLIGGSILDDGASGNTDWYINPSGGLVSIKGTIFSSAGRTATNVFLLSGSSSGSVEISNNSPSALTTIFNGGAQSNSINWIINQPTAGLILNPMQIANGIKIPGFASDLTGLSGAVVCDYNTTPQALKCSYNNGAFSAVPLLGLAQTWTATQTLPSPVITGTVPTYNGSNTAGQGLVPVSCITSQRTETAADANLLTCAIPAQAGSYRIRFVLSLSAANAATLGWTATWTDSNGAAQTPTNLALINDTIAGANGSAAPALTFTTSSVSDYHGDIDIDVNNAGTSIVVKLTFSGTSFTGKASGTVERII